MAESIKEFAVANLDSHLPKKISKFRSRLLHTLFETRLVKEPKIFQIAAGGVVRQLSKIKGPLQSASIARFFKIFGSCTYKKVLATLCDERDQKKIG